MNKIISLILLVTTINASALVPVHDGNLYVSEDVEEMVEQIEEDVVVVSSSFNS